MSTTNVVVNGDPTLPTTSTDWTVRVYAADGTAVSVSATVALLGSLEYTVGGSDAIDGETAITYEENILLHTVQGTSDTQLSSGAQATVAS